MATLRAALGMGAAELAELLQDGTTHGRLLMMHFSLWGRGTATGGLAQSVQRLQANPVMLRDLLELLELRRDMVASVTPAAGLGFVCPLRLHASYTRDELMAALGHWTLQHQPEVREGVLHLKELPADLFLITLNKTEREYSPTTMYEDYAISERLFHWQSQSTTSPKSPTGQRYIHHRQRGHSILLAVRENRNENGLACPFYFLGAADYVAHEGTRPMSITWCLHHPLPAHLLRVTERLAVA